MREYSTPAVAEVPAVANLTDIVFERPAREPDRVVLRRKVGTGWRLASPARPRDPAEGSGGTWEDVPARQFRDEVASLARGLLAAGIASGDRIALLSRTRYEWTVADYAIWAAGAVTVPIYETSSAEQAEWILTDSGARAAILETPAHYQVIRDVLHRCPEVRHIWLIEGGPPAGGAGTGPRPPETASLEPQPLTALATGSGPAADAELSRRRSSRGAGDLATIIYTSGTTGRPKGCEITHGNLLSDVRNAVRGPLAEIFEVPGSATLLFLPLAHSFARVIEVGCLEAGVVLGHTPDPKPAALLPDLRTFRPTFVLAVPRVFEKVYNSAEQQAAASPVKGALFRAGARAAIEWSRAFGTHKAGAADGVGLGLRLRHALFDRLVYAKLRAALGGQVGYAVSGGAPLGERLGHFFRGAGVTVIEGYGLTETTAAATVNRPDRNKIGTVGQPLPGVSVRIAGDGEVCIAGANVFTGYWRNESATADALAEGRWMRTGDVGELDADGYLRVTGRKKELIVTAGGKNVAPTVLEDRLRAHPLVSQCMVVGDARPYVGCLITLDEESLSLWKDRHAKAAGVTVRALRDDPDLVAEMQTAVEEANKVVSHAEAIKRFRILATDFTESAGYLTPSLKIRRGAVAKDFSAEIDALYS